MKRPFIALSLLLSALAGGLAVAGPRSCEAASLGQLAFAIAVENSDNVETPVCCPLECCPFADNSVCSEADVDAPSAAEELDYLDALAVAEDEVELNAAETVDSDDSELAIDDYSDDYSDEFSDDYNYDYYGYEDYSDEYADEYGPSWTDEADEVAAEEMELNAPAVAEDEGPNWDEYYAEYADDYCEDENCYDSDDYDPYACMPCEEVASIEMAREEEEKDDEQVFCPYDCYGHQFGDDYTYEDDDYSYDEEDYADEYGQSYDEYDYDYESDYQYQEQAEESADAPAALVTEADDQTQAEVDYESYYEDYYSDEYDSTSGDDYDYEQYYSQEYYDSLEADSADDAAEPMDDYSSEYDEAYDEAVYGVDSACHGCDPAPADWTAALPEDEVVVDDLPWADEIECEAEAPMTAATPTDCGYGCSYADAYRRPLDEQGVPYADAEAAAEAPASVEAEAAASIESIDLPQASFDTASVKSLPQMFNVPRLASICGESVAAWSKSLADLVPTLQVARAEGDEAAPRR